MDCSVFSLEDRFSYDVADFISVWRETSKHLLLAPGITKEGCHMKTDIIQHFYGRASLA